MQSECLTEALVLDKEPAGESDARVFLYTKNLGKVLARAVSARKITSKLNGHLEPLCLISVRLVGENQFRIADALKIGSLPPEKLKILPFIKELTSESQADLALWSLIINGNLSEEKVLEVSGFDKKFAGCQKCGRKTDLGFSIPDLAYFCSRCIKFVSRKT